MLSSAAVNSLGDMVSPCRTPLLVSIFFASSSCMCRFPWGVGGTHLLSPVLEARSVLLEFALSRMLSRSRRMRCRVGYYIIWISPSVGLRRGCGLSLSIRFWIQLALVAGFRRVSSLAFSLLLSWVLSWPSICVLPTFFRLFDAMIVSRMISWFYFLMSSLAFFLMILHISAYSIIYLLSPVPAISRRFVTRARVGDDILDLCGLLIALATLDALCWVVSVMVSLMVSMSHSSWSSMFSFQPLRPIWCCS